MKKTFVTLVLAMACAVLSAQTFDVRERVMDNLQLARGCNYMLDFDVPAPQKAPRGYESFIYQPLRSPRRPLLLG